MPGSSVIEGKAAKGAESTSNGCALPANERLLHRVGLKMHGVGQDYLAALVSCFSKCLKRHCRGIQQTPSKLAMQIALLINRGLHEYSDKNNNKKKKCQELVLQQAGSTNEQSVFHLGDTIHI